MGVRRMLRSVLVLLGALALGHVGVGLLVVFVMTSPHRRAPEATPTEAGLAYEDVELRSTDGVRLSGWWMPAGDSRRAALLVDGWGGDKSNEHVLKTAPIYHREGYNVLAIDLRAHGESGGGRRTLGYRETRDVLGALAWLRGRGYRPEDTVLHGWSMGGTTVVRAAPGTGIAAVVEEAGYADLPRLLESAIPRVAGLPRLLVPGILLAGKLWPDFDPWAVRPEREASELWKEDVPLFVIHSTGDDVIPIEHAKMLAAAHPDARTWMLDGYDHVAAFTHPEYEQRLRSFLQDSRKEANRGIRPPRP